MDEFKKYLKQSESDMNVDTPGDGVWQRIKSGTARKRMPVFIKYAAAACLLVIAGAAIFFLVRSKTATDIIPELVKHTDTTDRDSTALVIKEPDTVTITNNNPSDREKIAVLPKKKTRGETKSIPEPGEIAGIDKSYNTLIAYQMQRLRSTPVYAENPAYFAEFASQLKTMDRDEVSIRNDIKIYGLNDQLLEQLINVYQQKLNVLKSLRAEINKMNSNVKKHDQSLSIRKPFYLTL